MIWKTQEGALRCFVRCRYGEEIRIAEGDKDSFHTDAGHLLGSSSVEVWVKEGKTEKKISLFPVISETAIGR